MLAGYEKAHGPDHVLMPGRENALGPDHTSTPKVTYNLGILYGN
jgi:hypothetical protein